MICYLGSGPFPMCFLQCNILFQEMQVPLLYSRDLAVECHLPTLTFYQVPLAHLQPSTSAPTLASCVPLLQLTTQPVPAQAWPWTDTALPWLRRTTGSQTRPVRPLHPQGLPPMLVCRAAQLWICLWVAMMGMHSAARRLAYPCRFQGCLHSSSTSCLPHPAMPLPLIRPTKAPTTRLDCTVPVRSMDITFPHPLNWLPVLRKSFLPKEVSWGPRQVEPWRIGRCCPPWKECTYLAAGGSRISLTLGP